MDLGEDEELKARVGNQVTGKDLDVPGAELDDNEALGQEDEENNYYSLGGEKKKTLGKTTTKITFNSIVIPLSLLNTDLLIFIPALKYLKASTINWPNSRSFNCWSFAVLV